MCVFPQGFGLILRSDPLVDVGICMSSLNVTHSRTPCRETSTNAYGWATMNVNKSQTSEIKLLFREGCSTALLHGRGTHMHTRAQILYLKRGTRPRARKRKPAASEAKDIRSQLAEQLSGRSAPASLAPKPSGERRRVRISFRGVRTSDQLAQLQSCLRRGDLSEPAPSVSKLRTSPETCCRGSGAGPV